MLLISKLNRDFYHTKQIVKFHFYGYENAIWTLRTKYALKNSAKFWNPCILFCIALKKMLGPSAQLQKDLPLTEKLFEKSVSKKYVLEEY